MSDLPSYEELHRRTTGKVSDKWDTYLDVYDSTLRSYRKRPISLLEIGVQNGGSLETWAEFLPAAQKIIGCDINPDCSKLTFLDPRIKVIVGDATEAKTVKVITDNAPNFDIVIEDGSHTSRDIVRSFATYLPRINPGGIYIAEDLHASYWAEFGGGLGHPSSGIELFKALADCLNSKNWGRNDINQSEYINDIANVHDAEINDNDLSEISSITFYDSMCIVRKAELGKSARIMSRIIGGAEEAITPGHHKLPPIHIPNQEQRAWNSPSKMTSQLSCFRQELEYSKIRLTGLTAQRDNAVKDFQQIQQSRSWRVTSPLRLLSEKLKATKVLKLAFRQNQKESQINNS